MCGLSETVSLGRVVGLDEFRIVTGAFKDGGGGFITRTFDSENLHIVDYIIIGNMMQFWENGCVFGMCGIIMVNDFTF